MDAHAEEVTEYQKGEIMTPELRADMIVEIAQKGNPNLLRGFALEMITNAVQAERDKKAVDTPGRPENEVPKSVDEIINKSPESKKFFNSVEGLVARLGGAILCARLFFSIPALTEINMVIDKLVAKGLSKPEIMGLVKDFLAASDVAKR